MIYMYRYDRLRGIIFNITVDIIIAGSKPGRMVPAHSRSPFFAPANAVLGLKRSRTNKAINKIFEKCFKPILPGRFYI